MTTHVMIDLETLGTKPYSAILSLGAVKFDPQIVGDVQDKFHIVIDPASCQDFGLKTDAATIMWWFAPERDRARARLLQFEQHNLSNALHGFTEWFGEKSLPVWGNGAGFDNVILRCAYAAINYPCPWDFRDDRCFRTIKNMAPDIYSWVGPDDIEHDALNDALRQAYHLQILVRKLSLDI